MTPKKRDHAEVIGAVLASLLIFGAAWTEYLLIMMKVRP